MPSPSSPLSIIRAIPVSHQHLCQSPPSLLSASHQHSHLCLSSPLAEPPSVISITLVSLQEQLCQSSPALSPLPAAASSSSSSSSLPVVTIIIFVTLSVIISPATTQHHHHHSCTVTLITGAKKGHDSSHWQAFRAEPEAHPKVQSHRAMKQKAPPLERDP